MYCNTTLDGLQEAPWIIDCERTGYPGGFHYRREDGFETEEDYYDDEE